MLEDPRPNQTDELLLAFVPAISDHDLNRDLNLQHFPNVYQGVDCHDRFHRRSQLVDRQRILNDFERTFVPELAENLLYFSLVIHTFTVRKSYIERSNLVRYLKLCKPGLVASDVEGPQNQYYIGIIAVQASTQDAIQKLE